MRQNLRRNYRALASRNIDFTFRVIDAPSGVSEALYVFFALQQRPAMRHRASPQLRRYTSRYTRAFLRAMIERMAQRGVVRIFALSIADETVAMRLGFACGGGLYLYMFADDARWRTFGVLTITMSEIFKHAILSDYQFVYLSSARRLSNLRWRPEETRSGQVAIWQITPRARILNAARVVRRNVTRWVIALFNAFGGIPPRGRPPLQRPSAERPIAGSRV